MKNLTPRQIKFCQNYIENGLNATKAYMASGFQVKSEAEARACASRLLTKANVNSHIEEIQKKLQKSSTVTIEKIVKELAEIAFGGLSDAVEIDSNGSLKLRKNANFKCVESILTDGHGGLSVKCVNRIKALDLLCKILGLYKPQEGSRPPNQATRERILNALRKRINPGK